MDGVLNILKPPGMTSFDVIGWLRGRLGERKLGHAGTLDPAAAGVLPVFAGKATRAVDFMVEADKTYRAELCLGISTDTQDATGRTIGRSDQIPDIPRIEAVIFGMEGRQLQEPPMYSAVRIGGRRLYDLARAGITVERAPREILISSIRILDIGGDGRHVLFDVRCSKGTYVRTLCSDIGDRLGCGGHMSFLLRLRVGVFDIASAHTLEEIADTPANEVKQLMHPVDSMFSGIPAIRLNAADEKRIRNGCRIPLDGDPAPNDSLLRVYGSSGEFLGLGEMVSGRPDEALRLKMKKLFSGEPGVQ